MKLKLFLLICFAALNSFAQTTIVGSVKDSVTGSNVMSGSIEFIPIDTPKTNTLGEILFGYKTVAYINDGKFSAVLTEGQYDCVIGPFNVTKPITVAAGTNVVNLATIYGNTDNSLVTFFQFNTLSNALASIITGSVSGVATFNGRSGAVTLTSNDVYAVDIAAEKIKFTTDAYVHDTNVLAFAVLSVANELSAATNTKTLIIQSLGKDPTTNATIEYVDLGISNATGDILDYVNNIIDDINNQISTNGYASTNYVNDAVYNATNGLSTGSMDYTVTNHFATTNYVMAAMGEATDYTDSAILDFLNNTLSDAATTPIVNITNGLATTNFVKNYVDSLTVTNSGDSSISLSNITAVYVLSIKSNTTIAPFLNVSASEFRSASLFITNGIGSNCTVKLPDGTSCLGGTTLTVTNAQRRVISVGGFINFTNAVSQALP